MVSCGLGLILNATYFYYERTRDKFDSQNYAVIEAIIKQKGQEYKISRTMESRLDFRGGTNLGSGSKAQA